jgi:hypothetical protein
MVGFRVLVFGFCRQAERCVVERDGLMTDVLHISLPSSTTGRLEVLAYKKCLLSLLLSILRTHARFRKMERLLVYSFQRTSMTGKHYFFDGGNKYYRLI